MVLDANILIRAVLGVHVLALLRKYAKSCKFVAPVQAFEEAREHLRFILQRRRLPVGLIIEMFELLPDFVRALETSTYSAYEGSARARLVRRDEDDWPILACALALDCPIWTEDRDFFGCGVATWTSDRVKLYFTDAPPAAAVAE